HLVMHSDRASTSDGGVDPELWPNLGRSFASVNGREGRHRRWRVTVTHLGQRQVSSSRTVPTASCRSSWRRGRLPLISIEDIWEAVADEICAGGFTVVHAFEAGCAVVDLL